MRRSVFFAVVVVAIAALGALWLRTPRVRLGASLSPAEAKTEAEASAPVNAMPAARPVVKTEPVPETVTPGSADRAKLVLLEEVLATRNDNDPRLDLSFRNLSGGTKRLFRERYRTMRRESFNDRGTLVLILAREMKNREDAAFLGEVLRETPCRGLRDCRVQDPPEAEHVAVNATTLAYPQLVALAQIQKYFERHDRDPAIVAELAARLREAKASPVARIAEYASRIQLPNGE